MRSKEFIKSKSISEVTPFVTALKGAIDKNKSNSSTTNSNVSQPPKQTIGTIGSSTNSTDNKMAVTQQDQTSNLNSIPPGTKFQIEPSNNPNKLTIKLDGANFELDMNDQKNKQLLQQLTQIKQ